MDLSKLPEWKTEEESYEYIEDDGIERPPLLSKGVYVPAGLYEQPWSQVKDAYGSATLTPYYIEALASPNEGDRMFGSYGLYSATTHQGSVYEASKMAVPFLVDMLNAEKEHDFIIASHFISRIAVGEVHFITSPNDIERAKSRYFYDVFNYLNELKVFYDATQNEEMERLLCFYPGALPDYLDLNISDLNRLASRIVAQGFIANGNNCKEHIQTVRELMYNSPSLLVRGAAAICLSYSHAADEDVMQLLKHLAIQEFEYSSWVWNKLDNMALCAWLYSASTDTLLNIGNHPPVKIWLTKEDKEELAKLPPAINPFTRLSEALKREFKPLKLFPYLPDELSPVQKRILEGFEKYAPYSLHSFDGFNLPDNITALKRLLGKSDELLCTKASLTYDTVEGLPLWYILECYLQPNNFYSEEIVARALAVTDVWTLFSEVFTKRCTLSLHSYFGDGTEEKHYTKLISVFANALYDKTEEMKPFLDEWLRKSKSFKNENDWAFETPAEHIAVALLVMGRNGKLSSKYFPLVRPYHSFVEHSRIPLPILAELLNYTTPQHQEKICSGFCLYNTDKPGKDELCKIISMVSHSWKLLKGCKGEWVIEKMKDAVKAWNKTYKKYPDRIPGDPFPYNDAVTILKNQDTIDYKLLHNLPRF